MSLHHPHTQHLVLHHTATYPADLINWILRCYASLNPIPTPPPSLPISSCTPHAVAQPTPYLLALYFLLSRPSPIPPSTNYSFSPPLSPITALLLLLSSSPLSYHPSLPSLPPSLLAPSQHSVPFLSLSGVAHSRPVHILVATPGRLCELMTDDEIPMFRDMSGLKFLIVDEADRIVEEGHFPEVSQKWWIGRRKGGGEEGIRSWGNYWRRENQMGKERWGSRENRRRRGGEGGGKGK